MLPGSLVVKHRTLNPYSQVRILPGLPKGYNMVRKKVEIFSDKGGTIMSWSSKNLGEIIDEELAYCIKYDKGLVIIVITEAKNAL